MIYFKISYLKILYQNTTICRRAPPPSKVVTFKLRVMHVVYPPTNWNSRFGSFKLELPVNTTCWIHVRPHMSMWKKIYPPPVCDGCKTGKKMDVWTVGLETRAAELCRFIQPPPSKDRYDYCCEQYKNQYPMRAAAVEADLRKIWRDNTESKDS